MSTAAAAELKLKERAVVSLRRNNARNVIDAEAAVKQSLTDLTDLTDDLTADLTDLTAVKQSLTDLTAGLTDLTDLTDDLTAARKAHLEAMKIAFAISSAHDAADAAANGSSALAAAAAAAKTAWLTAENFPQTVDQNFIINLKQIFNNLQAAATAEAA